LRCRFFIEIIDKILYDAPPAQLSYQWD